MPDIANSVGEQGRNAPHDVALVQLMLRVVKNAQGAPYSTRDYDGVYDIRTKAAILAFQTDHGLKNHDRPGLVEPRSFTWQKLVERLPHDYNRARSVEGVRTVYLSPDGTAATQSITAIMGSELAETFKAKIVRLVQDFYRQSGIVLTVHPSGWRRNFQGQVGLNSDSGPGESIHQYGQAVDIGFSGLRWIAPNGHIERPLDSYLKNLPIGQQAEFWNARDKIGFVNLGLFPTDFARERIHVQAFRDHSLDSASSLAALLHAVGPRRMKWEPFEMAPTKYRCDLGLGGDKYLVGTATQIWRLESPVSKSDLAKALGAKMKIDAAFSVETFLGLPTRPGLAKPRAPDAGAKGAGPSEFNANDVSEAHVVAIRKLLKAEFEAADKRWREWKPVYYPNEGRRPRSKH